MKDNIDEVLEDEITEHKEQESTKSSKNKTKKNLAKANINLDEIVPVMFIKHAGIYNIHDIANITRAELNEYPEDSYKIRKVRK